MKKLTVYLIVLSLSVLFFGCPYTSSVPIDKPSVKVNSKMFGIWQAGESTKYEVMQNDAFTYKINQLADSTSEQGKEKPGSNDITMYDGHVSQINNIYFLNVKNSSPNGFLENGDYYLYKIDFTNDKSFTLTEVTTYIKEKFDNSEDLKNYIKKYMDSGLSFFYGDAVVYTKLK